MSSPSGRPPAPPSDAPRRKRGRPSLLDSLQARAVQSLEAERAAAGLAAAGEVEPLAVRPRQEGKPETLAIPEDVVQTCFGALPPVVTHPLGGWVLRAATAAHSFASGLHQSMRDYAMSLRDPQETSLASASLSLQSTTLSEPQHFLKSAERRLTAAAELTEREHQVAAQVVLLIMPHPLWEPMGLASLACSSRACLFFNLVQ